MNLLKFGLIFFALSFFIFACTQSSNNSNTISQNSNGLPVSNASAQTNSNSATNTKPVNDELASAKKIYAEKCVICHKENGEGGETDLEGSKFNVPSYKSEKALKSSDEKLLDYIQNGDEEMPPFKGKITTEDMKSLVKLIRRDFQGK